MLLYPHIGKPPLWSYEYYSYITYISKKKNNKPLQPNLQEKRNDFHKSISHEDISCINLLLGIIQAGIIAVGDDGMALCLEGFEVVLYSTAKEGAAIFQGWLIDDYLCTLCLDTLHDALDG